MEAFLSTLLGAFLGVSLPFVISSILERINFRRLLNTIFVQYETYGQHCRLIAESICAEAERSWASYQKTLRKTLRMNFEPLIDCSDLMLAQYSKFLRPSDAFAIIQDKQNVAIVQQTVLSADYQTAADLRTTLSKYNEFLIRRTWTLFMVAKRRDLQFASEKYNLLMSEISRMKNKRVTKVPLKNEFLKHVKQ